MNADITRGYESLFGPPSEPISIRKFLDDAVPIVFSSKNDALDHTGWQNLPEDERTAVEAECSGSVGELKATAETLWNNPMLSAHLYRTHATAVNALHSQAGGVPSKGRKRKHLPDSETAEARPEVCALQQKLDAVSLQCWRLGQESAFFMRTPRHSDFNALKHVKKSGCGKLCRSQSVTVSPYLTGASTTLTPALSEPSPRPDTLITLTVHNRVPWMHSQLTRFSQHIVLSSQTLGDFVRSVPCGSKEMPNEVADSRGNVVGYAHESEGQAEVAIARSEEGCLLLIEGVVYGDGGPGNDYADKLLSHLQKLPEEKRPQITKSSRSLSQTFFALLTLRVNQPYWLLHQGKCEHFVIVDQIRLNHPLDVPSGYPLTTYISPHLGDVCKACAKVPAVLTVVGDKRLGESPCLLCAPCWQNMGPPQEEDVEEVMIVPLVKHHKIWEEGMDM